MKYKKLGIAIGTVFALFGTSIAGTVAYAHIEKQNVVKNGKESVAYVVSKEKAGFGEAYGAVKVDVEGKSYRVPVDEREFQRVSEGSTITVYESGDKVVLPRS
ncbi:hypothetical protein B4086_5756 [Bacillus cereus]|nr:hypothetical protein B4086_5756 [Bacillus cereus]